MMEQKIAFSHRYGPAQFWRRIVQWPIAKILHRRGLEHSASGRRQLLIFSFDVIGQQINIEGAYEARELETLLAWLPASGDGAFDGTALDIGANIGNHTLFFAEHFRKVISFEPNPRTFQVLGFNTSETPNVECSNIGLSDAPGTASLSSHPNNVGGSRLAAASDGGVIPVTIDTVDAVVGEQEPVRLIKIDVEGHEAQVIRGAERTIRSNKPVILFEQHLDDFKDGKSSVIELLRTYGYQRFATIKPYPRADRLGRLGNGMVAVIGRALFGETMKVAFSETIQPGFHSFLIAAPDWLKPVGADHANLPESGAVS